MSWLSKLFGGGDKTAPPTGMAEEYEGFTITPRPQRDGSHYRVAALIEKDGKRHELIRADVLEGLEPAVQVSLDKARQMIDEQGERLFDSR